MIQFSARMGILSERIEYKIGQNQSFFVQFAIFFCWMKFVTTHKFRFLSHFFYFINIVWVYTFSGSVCLQLDSLLYQWFIASVYPFLFLVENTFEITIWLMFEMFNWIHENVENCFASTFLMCWHRCCCWDTYQS